MGLCLFMFVFVSRCVFCLCFCKQINISSVFLDFLYNQSCLVLKIVYEGKCFSLFLIQLFAGNGPLYGNELAANQVVECETDEAKENPATKEHHHLLVELGVRQNIGNCH